MPNHSHLVLRQRYSISIIVGKYLYLNNYFEISQNCFSPLVEDINYYLMESFKTRTKNIGIIMIIVEIQKLPEGVQNST